MVFSSIPAYLDPANWQQAAAQPNHQFGASSSLLLPNHPPPPPPPPPQPHGGGGAGSIRPGSMADRARLANIPMPEMALKCPRCESTNTKFCYFNNYSLSQPRHFCKTCRRYWTRGGALRNVPVGGGCRRNKRSKGSGGGSSSSKSSPANSVDMPTSSGNSSGGISSNTTADILGLGPGSIPPIRFMSPLHHQLSDHHHLPSTESIGLNYGSISGHIGAAGSADSLGFQIGSGLATGGVTAGSSLLSMSGIEQWRLGQQFPFFGGGLDSSMLPFEEMAGLGSSRISNKMMMMMQAGGGGALAPPVKMEDNQEMNLSRQFLGGMTSCNLNPGGAPAAGGSCNDHNHNHNYDQYWSNAGGGGGAAGNINGAPWTDLSGFSSSSTSNAL